MQSILERKAFPRNVNCSLLGEDVVNVHEKGEVLGVENACSRTVLDRSCNALCNNERLKGNAVELCLCFYTWAKENASEPKAKKDIDPQVKLSIKEVETRLKKSLGSRVKIKVTDPNTGKGKLVIDYKNNEDLDRLIELLG